jgi:Flp pilus assembly protein TadG
MADRRPTSSRPTLTGLPLTFAKGFLKATGGQAAVEMALVATPFFMLLFGILELSMIFLVSSSLENATAQAARTIRTGAFQNGASPTEASLKTTICNAFGWMQSSCASNLYLDVRTFANFSSITAPQPIQDGAFNAAALTCNPGSPGDIVVVRAYYQWPLIAPLMSQALQQLNGGVTLLTSTATFRNEPYTANAAPQAC